MLSGIPAKPVAIEPTIVINGIKNPTCTMLVGFASRGLYDTTRKTPNKLIRHTVIVEPDLGVFHALIQREFIGDILLDQSTDILLGIDGGELKTQIFKVMAAVTPKLGCKAASCMQPEFITDPFLYGDGKLRTPQEAKATLDICDDAIKQVFLAMGCAADSFHRWEQVVRAKDHFNDCHEIKGLFGKFATLPAVVVGAGPSMDDFVGCCKEYNLENNSIIIACDAALPKLLKNGIRPHIVTRGERKFTTIFEGTEGHDLKGIYFATYPWVAKEFFEMFPDKFLLFRDNGVCKWTSYDPGSVNGGVSSANTALELAYLFGCKDIVMTGVDLCFIDNKSHTEGTQVEFNIEKSKDKWREIPGNSGPVTTIPVWNRCLNEYVQAIAKHYSTNATVFNTSLKGALIHGATVRPWSELGGIFNRDGYARQKIEKNLNKIDPTCADKFKVNMDNTNKLLTEFRHDLKKFFLNIYDSLLTCGREEERLIQQAQTNHDPTDFFRSVEQIKKSLKDVYRNICQDVDDVKTKYFTNRDFLDTMIDMCQLETFQMENKANSLANIVPIEHERLKAYVALHMGLFKTLDFYAGKIIGLIEKGPLNDMPITEKMTEVVDAHYS